jgi:hypothetical protein
MKRLFVYEYGLVGVLMVMLWESGVLGQQTRHSMVVLAAQPTASSVPIPPQCSESPQGSSCEPSCCGWGKQSGCPEHSHRNKCCVCVCDVGYELDATGKCVTEKQNTM